MSTNDLFAISTPARPPAPERLPQGDGQQPWTGYGPLVLLVGGPWQASAVQAVVGELVSTAMFIFVANTVLTTTPTGTAGGTNTLTVAVATAATTYAITVLFAAMGTLTAFNSAISLTHFLTYGLFVRSPPGRWRKDVGVGMFVATVAAQFGGAVLGVLGAWAATQSGRRRQALVVPAGSSTAAQFVAEMLASTVLATVFVGLGLLQQRRLRNGGDGVVAAAEVRVVDRAGLFAALVLACVLAVAPVSGAVLNPTRYLAMAVVGGSSGGGGSSAASVFVVAPLVGGLLAALVLAMLVRVFRVS